MTKPFITLRSGICLNVAEFSSEHVYLPDIAHSLSLQTRYMGHCNRFYSVAEHSTNCCKLAESMYGYESREALCALFHDAHEAYVMDFPTPHKDAIPGYREVEQRVEAIVRAHFSLPQDPEIWEKVKIVDKIMLHAEANKLFDTPPPWAETPLKDAVDLVNGDDWEIARDEFRSALRIFGFSQTGGY